MNNKKKKKFNLIAIIKNFFLMFIYPNRLLRLFRVTNLDENSNRFLGNDNRVKVLALFIAIVVAVVIRYTPPEARTVQQHLQVPLTIQLDPGYTVFSADGNLIPQNIDVWIVGGSSDVALLMTQPNVVTASINLTGMEVGVVQEMTRIDIGGVPSSLEVFTTPAFLENIEIAPLVDREFPIEIQTNREEVFKDLPTRYSYKIELIDKDVIINGPESLLDDIAVVRAIFNATNVNLESYGENIYEAQLTVSSFTDERIVQGITLTPQIVRVRVTIYEHTKNLKINVNQSLLHVPSNIRINSVSADLEKVEVWGNIDDISSSINLPRINFTELDNEGNIILPLTLPEGVESDVNEIKIHVNYEEIPQRNNESDD